MYLDNRAAGAANSPVGSSCRLIEDIANLSRRVYALKHFEITPAEKIFAL